MQGPEPPPSTSYDFEHTPLFMSHLPTADPEKSDDKVALEALQSLLYDGTPEEIGENLKLQANEQYRGKRYREANAFYTQALKEVGNEISADLKRTILCNRAACHYELGNYGSCLRDCAATLSLSASNPQDTKLTRKALFRSAGALYKLERFNEAVDALKHLESLGPDPSETTERQIRTLMGDIERAYTTAQRKAVHLQETERRRTSEGQDLRDALQKFGIVLPKNWSFKAMLETLPPNVKPPALHANLLSFPVFLLRPLHQPATRDLILEWSESDTFIQQTEAAFGDESEVYEIYAVTAKAKLLKVGKNLTLAQFVGMVRKEGIDGVPLQGGWSLEFYLVPAGTDSTKAWINEMKIRLKS